MAFNMKTAAERLLKLADVLEKEAHDKTFFVCDHCNHTAALSTINLRRKEASERLNIVHAAPVSVNDKLACPVPECKGTMSYVASEESERYYMDDDQTPAELTPPAPPADESMPPVEEKKPTPPEGEINPEEIFQPVDEQDNPPKAEEELDLSFSPEDTADADKDTERTMTNEEPALDKSPEAPVDAPNSEEELTPPKLPDWAEKTPEEGSPEAPAVPETPAIPGMPEIPEIPETPEADVPSSDVPPAEDTPAEPSAETPSEVPAEPPAEETPIEETPIEETPIEETPAEETPAEEPPVEEPSTEETPIEDQPIVDVPPGYEDESKPSKRKREMEYPKKPLPKFEKMPKDASDDFIKAVTRYSL